MNYVNVTWEEQRNVSVLFPEIIYCEDIEIRRVHPLKQKVVADINKMLKDDDRVSAVVLFGSAVNLRCNIHSDIDVVVRLDDRYVCRDVKNDISEKIQILSDWKADILWYDELLPGERIYSSILKGVQIV